MTNNSGARPSLGARFLAFCTSVSTFWRAVTSAVVGFAAAFLALWLLSAALRPQSVVVAELNLPPPLLQQGYTPEVIVRRMLDDVNRLRDISNIDRAELATFEGAPSTPPPHLQSVGGISLGSIEYVLRTILGHTPLVVQGEIIAKYRDQGGPEFRNEVQHQLRVLRWANDTASSAWKSAARLPSYSRPAIQSAKSRQLWIARHRASLGS
jgi:hypothetical protein